ncbi:MAG TPA: lactate utilization protein B [Anaeromyxobacteraceae bacterium]|nr:lactate utilization protein B [Anaeromyxobacteraceae bacterium]
MNTFHADKAAAFARDVPHAHWHDTALWFMRVKRDRGAGSVPEWEKLRNAASGIKAHTLSRLADYLEEFERNAKANGIQVHWARDGAEHNRIVGGILEAHGVKLVAKSKSMLTEECGLNPYLEARGLEIVDTDLGERIVQLAHEPPSHIVMPAIHKKKEQIGELFHQTIGTAEGLSDPKVLTEAARQHLRRKFLGAQAGLSGVNFAIADTGGIVVVTNEGNADMGTSLPPLHIASMGVEKVIPRARDLGVFLRLLARSATGQPISTYTTHFHAPLRSGELHVVIVDNGRSEILGRETFRRSLSCIRCGACLNTCPVYRRSGGYSYSYLIPGPIGAVLGAQRDPVAHASLPFASSLCGSCSDVCPVKIDLHHEILALREEIRSRKILPGGKRLSMRIAGVVLRHPALYRAFGWLARSLLRAGVARVGPGATWARQRELPAAPKETFRELWKKEREEKVA